MMNINTFRLFSLSISTLTFAFFLASNTLKANADAVMIVSCEAGASVSSGVYHTDADLGYSLASKDLLLSFDLDTTIRDSGPTFGVLFDSGGYAVPGNKPTFTVAGEYAGAHTYFLPNNQGFAVDRGRYYVTGYDLCKLPIVDGGGGGGTDPNPNPCYGIPSYLCQASLISPNSIASQGTLGFDQSGMVSQPDPDPRNLEVATGKWQGQSWQGQG
jgi:hypothetical protein